MLQLYHALLPCRAAWARRRGQASLQKPSRQTRSLREVPDGRGPVKLLGVALVVWLVGFALFSARAYGQGSLTTSDGLTFSLSSAGAVSTLQVGGTNYASSLPSGFFYREADTTPTNLVSNGSFESGTTGWSWTNNSVGSWSLDSTTGSAGTHSMKLYVPGTTGQRSPDLTSGRFPLVPNTPYLITCSMKSSGAGGSALALYVVEQDQTGAWVQRQASGPALTSSWVQKTLAFTSSPISVQAYVVLNISGGYGTTWVDDIRMTDPFGGSAPVSFGGSVTSSGGTVTQTASKNSLNLSAKFTSVGSAIRADVTLTDTTGTDRGVELAFRLPLDIPGWTWDNDVVTPRPIGSGIRYEYLAASSGHTHSVYPFATVRNSSAAFSLAVPMMPLMDRFTYDDSTGLGLIYDLGLSPAATKTPSKATVTFWIYSTNPKWGMRSAAEKYYALNSANFTSPATTRGAWAFPNTQLLSSIPNPQDFGWGYEEGHKELAFDNANGIVGMHYLSFPGWDINISGYTSQPPYSTLVSALNDALTSSSYTVDSTPTSTMAAAVIASSPYDENGLYHLSDTPYFWYGNRLQTYPVAPYSTLPGGTYPLRTRYSVDNQISMAQSQGNTLGGIFLDNTTFVFSNIENYRKSLWAYNNGPLSFSYKTGKTIQYNGDSMADFTAAFRSYVHSKNLVLMASLAPGDYVWFASNIDVVSGEVHGAEARDRAYSRRTLGYGKVSSTLFVPLSGTTPTAADVFAYLRQGLLLGYFPGFNGTYWDNSTLYERDRGVFQQYMPLIKKVAQAGWQPVNYATSSNSTILIERFGNPSGGTFYITTQNPGTTTSSFQLTIDGAGLGISSTATVTAKELVANQALTVTRSGGNLLVSDTLAAGETGLYEVTVSGTSSTSSAPVASFTVAPACPTCKNTMKFTDTSTNAPTSWSWNFGDGGTSTSQNPQHYFAASGTYTVTLTATNAGGSGSTNKSVTINLGTSSAPVASFTVAPACPTCKNTMKFTDTSTNAPTSWSWNFGDGGTSTLQNPQHYFALTGTYTVRLTASNASGGTSYSKSVTVSP